MKTLLWLDDIRDPKDKFWQDWITQNVGNPNDFSITWAKSFEDFEACVLTSMPDVICFDHDLGEEISNTDNLDSPTLKKSGYDCAKWLIDHCLDSGAKMPDIFIQSSNPVGAENIQKLIDNYRRHCG